LCVLFRSLSASNFLSQSEATETRDNNRFSLTYATKPIQRHESSQILLGAVSDGAEE